MNQSNALKYFFTLLITTAIVVGCNKMEEEPIPNPDSSFQAVLNAAGEMADPTVSSESEILSQEEVLVGNTQFTCTTKKLEISAAGGGDSGFPLFSPNAGVIYPGAMLQGNSLQNGNPDLIALERGSGTISTDVYDGNIQSSFEVETIAKGSVTNAINNIIAGSTGIVPANFNVKVRNIQSREQFALELGVDVNSTFVELESNLSYSSDVSKSTFMVNLTQSFYTMSYDIPVSRENLFAPGVTPEDLREYVYEGNPATYISDVTYGRVFYMLIESTSAQHELEAAVNSTFNGLTTKVQADIEVDYFSSLENVTYSVFAYGGEASGTLQAVGVSNMEDLVDILAETAQIGSGKPLSYVVRSVANNQIVATQLSTEYEVENCQITGVVGTLPMLEHWTGNVLSALGPVGAAYTQSLNSDKFILINQAGDQYMRSTGGTLSGPHPISSLLGEELPFAGIGAACMDYKTHNPDRLLAFDLSGINFAVFDNGTWGPVNSIVSFAGGMHPFNLTGVGAMAHAPYVLGVGPNAPGGDNAYHFNAVGDKYAHWYSYRNSSGIGNIPQLYEHFTGVRDLYEWGIDYSVTNKIPDVGAAIGFQQGDDHFTILFNKAGTKYVVYGNVNGDNPNEVVGPFDL
ncbi:MAG: thiol-activated cytolysin family protein [Lewinella sp.]|uniref:thiol-activated cytolysin family protein n=1 Tax=Lewinella sp. TaxID=2004506 RepID=UPI003D6C51C3